MGFLEGLMRAFKPRRLEDPDFGPLLFMHISRAPERSYWEGEWVFPPLGYKISIALPGDESGPTPEGRAFYLSRVAEFARIVNLVRPRLDAAFRQWLGRPLADDLWADVKLAGFGVEDPHGSPRLWDVSFETLGDKWLGIVIPVEGDVAQDAVVDC